MFKTVVKRAMLWAPRYIKIAPVYQMAKFRKATDQAESI